MSVLYIVSLWASAVYFGMISNFRLAIVLRGGLRFPEGTMSSRNHYVNRIPWVAASSYT